LARLEPPAVETIVDEAIAAAALTCTRAGANPPTRAELDEWLSATG
jgi:fructokinase